MSTPTGVNENLVQSPLSKQAGYPYRSGMGLINCAEWDVVFHDFNHSVATNVPNGFTAAVIDVGATITSSTAVATGAISISSANASEGAVAYLPKAMQLTAGKRFFMEIRVKTDDVTDNAIQFGLSDLTATTNPEDLWTTTAANLVAFGLLDGSAYPTMLSDAGNSGTSAQAQTEKLMVVNTWHTLAIHYDGAKLHAYVDGDKVLTWSSANSTIPTSVALAPFVGALNGNGAGGNSNLVDYVRFVIER